MTYRVGIIRFSSRTFPLYRKKCGRGAGSDVGSADKREIRRALREKWGYLEMLAMGDQEEQQIAFQKIGTHQLAAKTACGLRVFLGGQQAGHTREGMNRSA